ncbi:hypothetical protein [Nocardia sp. NPDC051570]|uniref:hypothetical protein n=1 Tax=Nocardia sp. NPDC051570 TaxID=3364324 RepID=UPI00378BA8E8
MTGKSGVYIGASAAELEESGGVDKAAGLISQKALFHRRGPITLAGDALVLSDWGDGGDLVLRRTDIAAVERKYTDLYGRFIGGLLDSGKPLILNTAPAGVIYLLIDRKEFLESTRNKEWGSAITQWLG